MSFIQVRNNANLNPFIRWSGPASVKQQATFAQDAGRAIPLAPFTLLSKIASSNKFTSLTDVDPTMVAGILICDPIGGTAAEFQALSSSSFKIGIDGEAVFEVVCDFSGLDSVEDTPGFLTGAALAVDMPIFQAVADAQFSIT